MGKDFTGKVIDNIVLSQIDAPIGSYRESDLSVEKFQEEAIGIWMLCNGQSCAGTLYAQTSNKLVVPDFVTTGAFTRQAKNGRAIGSYEADQFQGHKHDLGPITNGAGGAGRIVAGNENSDWVGSSMLPISDGTNGTPRTGNETRPVNIAVNIFIKVGY